jgi:plasmid stabilization system protein ParE
VGALGFSRLVESDLLKITAYRSASPGQDPIRSLLVKLETCSQKLADHPALGRKSDYIRPDLRRMEHSSHVVVYASRKTASGSLAFCTSARFPKITQLTTAMISHDFRAGRADASLAFPRICKNRGGVIKKASRPCARSLELHQLFGLS